MGYLVFHNSELPLSSSLRSSNRLSVSLKPSELESLALASAALGCSQSLVISACLEFSYGVLATVATGRLDGSEGVDLVRRNRGDVQSVLVSEMRKVAFSNPSGFREIQLDIRFPSPSGGNS